MSRTSKTGKRHTVYYFIEDERGCTPYVIEWFGSKNRFSQQDVARIAERKHAQRGYTRTDKNRQEVKVRIGENRVWQTLKSILWWIGAYTVAIVKFLLKLSWKIIVVFFVIFVGQLLLGMLLRR